MCDFSALLNRIVPRNTNDESMSHSSIVGDKPHSIEVLKHSKNYSKLLDIYVDSVKKNIVMKNCFKILFFIITMGSLVAVVCFFYESLQYVFKCFDKFKNLNEISIEGVLGILTVVIPAISSLIVAFIKIPEIIAQYLFNVKEDSYMNSVIKNIQDYDKAMFAMEHKIDELIMENKDLAPATQDEDIEESPVESVS